MSLTPLILGLAVAAAVWLVVVPIRHFGIVDRPSDVDQRPDGDDRAASLTFAGPSGVGPVTLALLAETGGEYEAAAWWLTSIPLATEFGRPMDHRSGLQATPLCRATRNPLMD